MPSEDLNIIDEIDNNKKKHLQADLSDAKFEGEILIGNQEEGNSVFVGTRRLQKNYTNWKSVSTIAQLKKKMENIYPLKKKESNGWMWHFRNGQKVYFEKADLQAIHTECVVRFLPSTSIQESNPGMFC